MWVVVCGSRGLGSVKVVGEAVEESGFEVSGVVSGAARGVDQAGEAWAKSQGISVVRCPANWSQFGRSAGMIRNREMLEIADAVVAIWDGQSKGTANMIQIAKKAGLPVYVKVLGGGGATQRGF